MVVRRFTAVLLMMIGIGFVSGAEARPWRIDQIPNGLKNGCLNCHMSAAGGDARNAFGQAVESRVSVGGHEDFWDATLAKMDSDGDGVTNGEELQDPDGTWKPGQTAPGNANLVTLPGDPSSKPNSAPVFTALGDQKVTAGSLLSFTVQATDVDNDPLTYSASGLPSGASFTNRSFTWTPGTDQGGKTVTVTFTASDGKAQATLTVNIAVAVPPNSAPVFTALSDQKVTAGNTVNFTVQATDADNDPLTYSASGLPVGASFTGGAFTWTPGTDQGGKTVTVTFTASDGKAQATLTVNIVVAVPVDRPVTITGHQPGRALTIAAVGDTVRFSVSATDPDGDPISYAWTVAGAAQLESGASLLLSVPSGTGDLAVSVSVSSKGTSAVQSWTVSRALMGDFDNDGTVGFNDFLNFVQAFGKRATDAGFDPKFDLDGNHVIDFGDFLIFVNYYGLSV